MKTPFTPYFKQASIPLSQVSREPFEPLYPLAFVQADCTEYWVGGACQFIYRWHDGYDVFVAVLEARIAGVSGSLPVDLAVESLLNDLHLVYQLQGQSAFRPPTGPPRRAEALTLAAGHHIEVYAPPSKAALRIKPRKETCRYAIAAVVPKGDWVTRHPIEDTDPIAALIHDLKAHKTQHRLVGPTPCSPAVQLLLNSILTLPRDYGMSLDDALNGPMVDLLGRHRTEDRDQQKADQLVAAARLWVKTYIRAMDGSQAPPTVALAAAALSTLPRRIRGHHHRLHGEKFSDYIVRYRIETAKLRLRAGEAIAAVALKLGWADVPAFSKQFKKSTGMTPGKFTKNQNRP